MINIARVWVSRFEGGDNKPTATLQNADGKILLARRNGHREGAVNRSRRVSLRYICRSSAVIDDHPHYCTRCAITQFFGEPAPDPPGLSTARVPAAVLMDREFVRALRAVPPTRMMLLRRSSGLYRLLSLWLLSWSRMRSRLAAGCPLSRACRRRALARSARPNPRSPQGS